jgi:putative ABC transport system permease protein
MKTLDLLSMAFMNLWRRKLRAFLTVLGMVIGTASIVVMVSLGIGINESFRETYERAGSLTTIQVNAYRMVESKNGYFGNAQEVVLDDKSVQSFQQIKGVTAVMPLLSTWGMIKSGQYVSDLSIAGVDMKLAEEFGFKLSEGKMPSSNSGSKYEIVLGSWTLQNFYNPKTGKQAIDANGNSKITLERSRFQMTFDYQNVYGDSSGDSGTPKGKMYDIKPVGVMAQEGNNYAYYSLMDINAVRKLAKENKNFMGIDPKKYSEIWVKCADIDQVLTVQKQIQDMGYGASSLQDALKAAQESAKQLQMLLGAIGGVALLVAAIGIMNTMMMSIYERTREIGIIKVLGCRMSNIATLFLTEAAYIGFFGGALGLALSYTLSFILNTAVLQSVGMSSVIPLYLSLGALLFSVVVALISGMYPAIRAMRLSALTAIRAE